MARLVHLTLRTLSPPKGEGGLEWYNPSTSLKQACGWEARAMATRSDWRTQAPDQETFARLANEWQQNRPRGADIEQMTKHPAYQRIIAMGEPAVPWLLQRLAEKPDHWFVALNAITGASPVPSESRGRIKEMAQAWLNWGREHGYDVGSPQ